MARDETNPSPTTRTASVAQSVRRRRKAAALSGWAGRALDALASPSMGWGLLIAIGFTFGAVLLAMWTRSRPLVAVGRVMDETRLVRQEITAPNEALTEQNREAARVNTPLVYAPDMPTLEGILTSLDNLPRTVEAAEKADDVDARIREQFGLTPELLAAVKSEWVSGQRAGEWAQRIRALGGLLARRPLLDASTWQRGVQEGTSGWIRLQAEGKPSVLVPRGEALNLEDRDVLSDALRGMARDAGFPASIRQLVVNRVMQSGKPTYTFNAAATTKEQNAAAAAVPSAVTVSPVGQIIFRRGETLSPTAARLYADDITVNEVRREPWQRWLGRGGLVGVYSAISVALAGYTVLFCARVRRNAQRILGVAGVLLGCMAAACIGASVAPEHLAAIAVTPSIFVAMVMTIGYDRRAALAYALLHGLAVCIALRAGIGLMTVMIAGIACVVWSLKEIRDRDTLFRSTLFTAMGVGCAQVLVSLLDRPLVPEVLPEIAWDAAKASGGALGVGGLTLFLMPTLERAFKVTTGLTLIELRDPRQPLLRELQQRAPGTYNHSLSVATIAEAAADAIGGDGLLAYVGALYHDIGKMNKPEYFVENQQGGPNRHDRLSPAMSLLLIVGHVKDGMELAREFHLPARIAHFIEAHHGTTLVEFFYHRACRQAEAGHEDDSAIPDEFEYRYPGPKPKTKEVAVVMISDAVESAARAMSDPTPARIDALVREIAHRRLMDGQFDECELTLKDLARIIESVSRTVASMHHGRISYPEAASPAAAAQ